MRIKAVRPGKVTKDHSTQRDMPGKRGLEANRAGHFKQQEFRAREAPQDKAGK